MRNRKSCKPRGLPVPKLELLLLNVFIVSHASGLLLVGLHCSQAAIHTVSLLNQQISLFPHSVFLLLGAGQTSLARAHLRPYARARKTASVVVKH